MAKYVTAIEPESGSSYLKTQSFELADLTIFIGPPNRYKTRILRSMLSIMNLIKSNKREHDRLLLSRKLILSSEKTDFVAQFISTSRTQGGNLSGTADGIALAQSATKEIDAKVRHVKTGSIINTHGFEHAMDEQGSGTQHQTQLSLAIGGDADLLLIDEPELSQDPSGKLVLLRNIIYCLEHKQVIIATHDPTWLNQYLIKKFISDLINNTGKNYIVNIFSYSDDKYVRLDFNSDLDPEMFTSYLTQTYSGKPIHFVGEGSTESYYLQAMCYKTLEIKNRNQFAQKLALLSFHSLGGSNWKSNIQHLPNSIYYSVLAVVDSEHSEILTSPKVKHITDSEQLVSAFNRKQTHGIFTIVLPENSEATFGVYPKPYGIANHILGMNKNEYLEMIKSKPEIALIQNCIEKLIL